MGARNVREQFRQNCGGLSCSMLHLRLFDSRANFAATLELFDIFVRRSGLLVEMTRRELVSPRWWRAHFEANGYRVVSARLSGLFYTGNMLFGSHLSIPARRHVAGWLGSACHLYIVEPVDGSTAEAPSKVGAEVS